MGKKLNYEAAEKMRNLRELGVSVKELQQKFKVGESTIFAILRGARFATPPAEELKPLELHEPGRQEHIEARISELANQEVTEEEFATLSPEDQVAYASAQMRRLSRKGA